MTSGNAAKAAAAWPWATMPPMSEADLPLISVLVRSMGRPSLHAALASVAAQTQPGLELLVLNASGLPHPPLPTTGAWLQPQLLQPGQALPRAAAANALLDAARGQALLFLDDDDTLDAGHLARLWAALHARPDAVAAYAGVRLQHADGHAAGVLDEAFDRRRLWLANFLPIHAVLFSRRLLQAGCRFDPALTVYEDWDFWQQAVQHGPFVHVPGVSATYRLVGDSGLSAQRDEALSQAQRQHFYRKWLPRLGADEAEQVARYAEDTRGAHQQALAAGQAAQQLAARLRDELAQARQQAAAAARQAQDRLHALDASLARTRSALEQRQADLDAALAEYQRLEAGYRAVTASLSWRITAPLRSGLTHARGLPRRLAWAAWRALPLSPDARNRVLQQLLQHRLGLAVLRRTAPHVLPTEAPPPAAPALDKAAIRADAEAELGRFLAGPARIELGRGGATPAVSVIVVMFNQAGLTRLCLQALADSRGVAFETLLVDNGSSDRVPALLQRVDGATVLRPGENLGFLRAVNLAAAQARGRHLLLLNNDALVEPGTLAAAVARLDADPGAAAVGGPILLWDGRLQEAGSIIWRDGSCLGYGRGDDPARPEYRYVRDVDYCSGAFLLIRRDWFERLGRFDDAYAPAYYEETDFCARLWEHGQRIVYDPAVRVRHFEFASEVASGWAVELQTRNRARFVERHAGFLAQRPAPAAAAVVQARQRVAAGRRRVLVIDDRVPLPWLGQGYPRAAALVHALAAAGHAVTHYPLRFPHESPADISRALPDTVEVLTDRGMTGLADCLRARRGLYDAVIVSRPHNMALLRDTLQAEPGVLEGARLVYDAEALFSLRDQARAELDGQPWPPEQLQRHMADELALARGADAVMAVSALEADHYRQAGYGQVQVLGHELPVVHGTPGFAARRGVLFIGALTADDTPNSDSLRWFVGQVWPQLRAALGPDARFDVVGACDAPSVQALAGQGVVLHGRVDDLAPFIDAARVFVVPTRYAAGLPHKAHEAAARGLPMVATPLIARQLGWAGWLPHAADASGFAQACQRLHDDETAWQQQHQAVLQAVARDCSPAAFREALERAIGVVPIPRAAQLDQPDQPPHTTLSATVTTACSSTGAAALDDAQQRTADLWGRDAEQRADAARALRHWSSHPVTAAEINRLVSGDAGTGWVAHLKRQHFPQTRARGLSLGCGSGAVVVDCLQLGVVQQMQGVDIAPAAVAVAQQRAAAAGVGERAQFRAANVNTLALDGGPYDLILFEQSLHHVDALDAVLDRCHDALAPDGLFVINEYVGADRFQWNDEVQRLMDAVLQRLPERLRRHPDSGALKQHMQRTPAAEVIALDPSEAIHASRIVAACEARFAVVERRDFGGTLLQFLLADIAANFDPAADGDVALLRLLTLLEMELVRAGAIASDFVFAVYRRR